METVIESLVLFSLFFLAAKIFQRVTVKEFEQALFYRNGRFVRLLNPGRYWLWKFGREVRSIDRRRRVHTVNAQELVAADHVSLKMSVAVHWEVTDAAAFVHVVEDAEEYLHVVVQLALREVVAAMPAEDFLARRGELGSALLAKTTSGLQGLGIRLHAVEVKDVQFPGELKKIFAEVVKARKEGEAALERARGESAALRNLANAAKMLENNPELLNLRLLQVLSPQGGGQPATVMLGVPQGLATIVKK